MLLFYRYIVESLLLKLDKGIPHFMSMPVIFKLHSWKNAEIIFSTSRWFHG